MSLIRMPALAAALEPVMMAVGVANPRAQGQAITSVAGGTDEGLLKTVAGDQPANEGYRSNADHRGHEDSAHPVHQPLHSWLACLGVLHEMDHSGQRGIFSHRRRLDFKKPVHVDGPQPLPDHLPPWEWGGFHR